MSSHGPHFLLVIFWILRSKKRCLVHLTVFLNCFQFLICLDNLYFSRSLLQFISHQLFECLVMLTLFKFFSNILSKEQTKEQTMFLKETTLNKSVTNFIQLVSLQPVDQFLQTKLCWKAPNEGYLNIYGMYKSNNKQLRYQVISNCKIFVC